MKVSKCQKQFSESYIVKFWYTGTDGFTKQSSKTYYSNSRSAHEAVEKFAKKELTSIYSNLSIISITYQ